MLLRQRKKKNEPEKIIYNFFLLFWIFFHLTSVFYSELTGRLPLLRMHRFPVTSFNRTVNISYSVYFYDKHAHFNVVFNRFNGLSSEKNHSAKNSLIFYSDVL